MYGVTEGERWVECDLISTYELAIVHAKGQVIRR
jgi:hypothetical protein